MLIIKKAVIKKKSIIITKHFDFDSKFKFGWHKKSKSSMVAERLRSYPQTSWCSFIQVRILFEVNANLMRDCPQYLLDNPLSNVDKMADNSINTVLNQGA